MCCKDALKEIIMTKQEMIFHGRINLQTLRNAIASRNVGESIQIKLLFGEGDTWLILCECVYSVSAADFWIHFD